MTTNEAAAIVKIYAANIASAEPEASAEYVNLVTAGLFAKYLAAAIDPGKYHFYPHPYGAAETTLHHAADYLFAGVA